LRGCASCLAGSGPCRCADVQEELQSPPLISTDPAESLTGDRQTPAGVYKDTQEYWDASWEAGAETDNRKVDLGPTVLAELRKWKLACQPNELNLIFPNESGNPINYSNMINRHFKPAMKGMVSKCLPACKSPVDVGDGVVGIPCAEHDYQAKEKIVITNTRNHNGEYTVLSGSTADQININTNYVKETFKASGRVYAKRDEQTLVTLSNFRFHDLRHTYASLLIEQGENIKYIQNQLGHSSPMVTLNVYAHLLEPKNQEAAGRLDKAIFG